MTWKAEPRTERQWLVFRGNYDGSMSTLNCLGPEKTLRKTWTVTSWWTEYGPGLKSSESHYQWSRKVSLHGRKWKSAGTVYFLCLLVKQINIQLKAGVAVPGCSSSMQLLPLLQLSATATAQSPRHKELGSMVSGAQRQLNSHGNDFGLVLQYSSRQAPLYLHSCPACH